MRKSPLIGAFRAVQLAAVLIMIYSIWNFVAMHKTPILPPELPGSFKDSPRPNSVMINTPSSMDPPNNQGPGFFEPGSLNLSRVESMSKCYINPKGMYKTHFGDGLCVVSASKKFMFYHVRKSGSSTGRKIAEEQFQGKDMQRCNRGGREDYFAAAFVRNPTTRFFAQYEEMFVRTLGNKMRVPNQFDVFHSDMKDYKAYERAFCGKYINEPRQGRRKPCDQIPSQDTGDLARRFEKFVESWDGTVFEAHLAMQAPILSHSTGMPYRVDYIGDVRHMQEDWDKIGKELGVSEVSVLRGRAYPRRMNTSYVSTTTYERMCRIAAIDYCCLNFALPPQCKDSGVSCRWTSVDGENRIVPEIR